MGISFREEFICSRSQCDVATPLAPSLIAAAASVCPPAAQSISHKTVPALAIESINASTTICPRIAIRTIRLFYSTRNLKILELGFAAQFARVRCTGYNIGGAGLLGP